MAPGLAFTPVAKPSQMPPVDLAVSAAWVRTAWSRAGSRVGADRPHTICPIRWRDLDEAIPAFLTLTVIVMPFTYSINGIGAGLIGFVILQLLAGRVRQVHPLMLLSVGSVTPVSRARIVIGRGLGISIRATSSS